MPAGNSLMSQGYVTTNKIWRPSAPTSGYTSDGQEMLSNMNYLFTKLNRGIDMINENGRNISFPTESAMIRIPQ
jgi:hypothetical protein